MKKLIVFLFVLSILSCERQTTLKINNRAFDGTLYVDNSTFPFKAGQSKTFELTPGFYDIWLLKPIEGDRLADSVGLAESVMVMDGYNEHTIKNRTLNIRTRF